MATLLTAGFRPSLLRAKVKILEVQQELSESCLSVANITDTTVQCIYLLLFYIVIIRVTKF
jgi:hypothetical protein